MGRGKVEIKKIENKTSRQVTFSKRRAGLMKKTHELSVLCDAQIGLVVFSSRGKLSEYCTPPLSMKQIITKYETAKGISISKHDNQAATPAYSEQVQRELLRMKNETLNLELSLQKYRGDDLSCVQYEDLIHLEHQLQQSINKVRDRKFQLIHEQLENLKRKEAMLENENQLMYHWLMSTQFLKQAAEIENQVQEQSMTELKLVEEQPLLSQFSFYGDDLQLGTHVPLHTDSHRLRIPSSTMRANPMSDDGTRTVTDKI